MNMISSMNIYLFITGSHDYKERFPDDISTRGDVDACSRASRAI